MDIKIKSIVALSLLVSALALSGCSVVYDYRGYMVLDEDFKHHSNLEGTRWSSKDFQAPDGRLIVVAENHESRTLWFGPIIPIFPVLLFNSPDSSGTPEPDFVLLEFAVIAKVPVKVDWNKVQVTTLDGHLLQTEPGDPYLHYSGPGGIGVARCAVRCDLPGTEVPHPVLSVDLPLVHAGDQFYKLEPFDLAVQEGRHFTFGAK